MAQASVAQAEYAARRTSNGSAEAQVRPVSQLAELPFFETSLDPKSEHRKSLGATTIQGARPTILTLPPELLSKIIANTLSPPSSESGNAVELLNISHVSSYFRDITVNEASLWAIVPYLNAVHHDFLETILERSQPYAINLSFTDDASLVEESQVWRQAVSNFHRVSRLHVEVIEASEGGILGSLFSISAPALKECIIHFFGNRIVPLDDLFPPSFNNNAPNLRKLDLTNCSIRPERYPGFPNLRDLTVMHLGTRHNDLALLPADGFFLCRDSLHSLQSLTLYSCIRVSDSESAAGHSFQGPLHLPSLQHFTLKTTIEGCSTLGKILRLPTACFRVITMTISPHWVPEQLDDAVIAAEAAASFIPAELEYTTCAGGMWGLAPSLYLFTAGQPTASVTIRFGIPTPNTPPDLDLFLLQVGRVLALNREAPLSTILFLHMCLPGTRPSIVSTSLLPYLLRPLIKPMKNLVDFASQGSDVWANGTIDWVLDQSHSPNLKNLMVPLDDIVQGPGALEGIVRFLTVRPEISKVTFRVSPSTVEELGHAASDGLRCLIQDISKDFPGSVALDWVVGW
ncbi:hypothetical protein DFP72DRAFT_1067390 [Ephemerocybe angulata]|uniref:Ig-like domain-containing protein n=1 Tax=Ephemerocybe angulata TaxID=980116 RepID=A0A8H6M799_9AGAR|nr:hypothetical protein DFP72DRAFT_1067390 [Tulosesus angulatus]